MAKILLIHNVRSAYNVGSLFRTADAMGVDLVITSGITPHPKRDDDTRLPHEIRSTENKISKTALGAEKVLSTRHYSDFQNAIKYLKGKNIPIIALEQSPESKDISKFQSPKDWALIVGSETKGLSAEELDLVDSIIEIPMLGNKESLNVAAAGAIAMFYLAYNG